MPIYEHKCKTCHTHKETFAISSDALPELICCNTPMSRVFSFRAGMVMQEHYDPTIGRAISDKRQLIEHGKRLSEESHLRTGLDTNYVLADYTDKEAMGVTDEGLHEQARNWRDEKQRPDISKKIERLI